MGVPPFALFLSEIALFQAGFAVGRPWLMGTVLALLVVAFTPLLGHFNRMLYGQPRSGVSSGEAERWPLFLLLPSVGVRPVLGVVIPSPLATVLQKSAEIIVRSARFLPCRAPWSRASRGSPT